MSELPEGWAEARLQDLAAAEPNAMTDGPFGSKLKTIDYTTEGARVVRLGNIGIGTLLENNKSYISLKKFQTLRKHEVFPGDLVIAALAEPVGRCARIPADLGLAVVKADCVRLKTHPVVSADYVMHAMNSPQGRARAEGTAHGVGRLRINMGEMRDLSVPLAPLNEQRRIVDKIEALTARSRRAKEALDAVPPLLDKLRQSILAAAFRGDLTKDWRANNPNAEPATVLLERIRKERRRRWEETTLAALKAKGRPPKDDTWKSKYQEPDPVDTEGLPELPEGWAWASLGQLIHGFSAGRNLKAKGIPATEGEFGVLKVSAVTWGEFRPEENKALLRGDRPKAHESVKAGDLLISRANTTELVGAPVLVDCDHPNLMLPDKILRIHYWRSVVRPEFLLGALRIPLVREYFAREATGTSDSMRNLSQPKLEATAIALAPLAEQTEVSERLHVALTRTSKFEKALMSQRTSLNSFEASILAKAFRGELVPQDPNDEPASVLLERIRAEREAPSTQSKTSNKRATKKRKAS